MSQLSVLAETLSDYSKSEAKRNGSSEALVIHLLSAFRRWQEESFDQRYLGLGERLRAHLAANRGTSTKSPEVSAEVIDLLTTISSADSAWEVSNRLANDLEHTLSQQNVSVSAPTKSEDGNTNTDSADPQNDPLPFSITESLIDHVAEVLSKDVVVIGATIMAAANSIAIEVLGDESQDLYQELCTAANVNFNRNNSDGDAESLIRAVLNSDNVDAGRLATRVALALVEVGEWSAARDAEITAEETDRIDGVRLRLRHELGDKLDAESESISVFESKFAQLVGMESVKTEIRKRVDFLVVNQRRQKRGLSHSSQRMHMAFVGNPGTGKTTVARLYGELLHDLGLLPSNKFIETDRSGLVGAYIGHTDQKTTEVIEKADGGVLFIDEAYALDDGYRDQKGFGEEATNVLVKQMEDRRDRLVVILAGYKEPTVQFMNVNPGLLSRVPIVVDFPDYSDNELLEIAQRIAEKNGLLIDSQAEKRLLVILQNAKESAGFGNARTVENIIESAQRNIVNRTSALGNLVTERELRTLLEDDLPTVAPPHKKVIGFGPTSYI